MPAIDLSILNQRQTPAFYADTLANRPSAGFIGRIFVSTNTFEFYRDNGTTWDLIGGPGTSTVTGTGANGQVTYWNGSSSITGSNDLFFDAVNGHFGIGTITPGTALDVKHNQNTVVQLEQETATNDTRIAFINSGVGLWRLGAFYNSGANDFGIYDVVGAIQPVTVKKTTGQVLIGTSTVGSGKLVVASAISDNGVQIVGASAPSLRIDDAESGPTKRAGLGISTAVNNFIQGSADRDFCMFNGSTTASPILFGVYNTGLTNVQEAARISAARNFLVGTSVDTGQKLIVNGTSSFNGTINSVLGNNQIIFNSSSATTGWQVLKLQNTGANSTFGIEQSTGTALFGNSLAYATVIGTSNATALQFGTNTSTRATIFSNGNFLISTGSQTDAGYKLDVNGTFRTTGISYLDAGLSTTNILNTSINTTGNIRTTFASDTSYFSIFSNDGGLNLDTFGVGGTLNFKIAGSTKFAVANNGNFLIGTTASGASKLRIVGLPTSAAGLSSGDIYSNLGVLTIVP